MAAGCLPVCYEAVGGRDFLRDGVNSCVFPNHHLFALLDRLFSLLEAGPCGEMGLRLEARATAGRFCEAATAAALAAAFEHILGAAARGAAEPG